MFMKRFAAAALIVATWCQPVMAGKIPDNIDQQPEKFCLIVGAMSNIIMARRNLGEPIEYLYEEASQIEQKQLRTYMRETVSMTNWFPPQTNARWFSQWNYNRCMEAMKD